MFTAATIIAIWFFVSFAIGGLLVWRAVPRPKFSRSCDRLGIPPSGLRLAPVAISRRGR